MLCWTFRQSPVSSWMGVVPRVSVFAGLQKITNQGHNSSCFDPWLDHSTSEVVPKGSWKFELTLSSMVLWAGGFMSNRRSTQERTASTSARWIAPMQDTSWRCFAPSKMNQKKLKYWRKPGWESLLKRLCGENYSRGWMTNSLCDDESLQVFTLWFQESRGR